MPLPLNQTYIPANPQEIRDDLLTDMRLAAITAGISDYPVTPGSDNFIRAEAYSQMAILQYGNISYAEEATDVFNATGEQLDDIRKADGLDAIPASPSTGKVIAEVSSGTVTIPAGQKAVLPNGKKIEVTAVHTAVANGDEVSVRAIDLGSDTNLAPPNTVRWVSTPHPNLATEARVSPNHPLTGGADEETDAQKRDRILLNRQNPASGGNWSHKVRVARESLVTVQAAFSYPALGGPSSEKVVVVKDIDPDNADFSRQLSSTALAIVRKAIHAEFGSPFELVVQSAADEVVDTTVQISIPDASSAGGNGKGWRDATPWPPLHASDNGRVSISTVHADNDLTLLANTTTSPIANVTNVAWWSPHDLAFHTARVTAVSGSAGAWRVTLDKPLADDLGNGPSAGDFVCPDAVNLLSYGETWRTVMRRLGPGENTSDSNRLPRAARHPDETQRVIDEDGRVIQEGWEDQLTIVQLEKLKRAHDEISDVSWSYRSATGATVASAVTDPPNVLVCRSFGVYPPL